MDAIGFIQTSSEPGGSTRAPELPRTHEGWDRAWAAFQVKRQEIAESLLAR